MTVKEFLLKWSGDITLENVQKKLTCAQIVNNN